MSILETERLVIRRWTKDDREPFANMNADKRVCQFLPKTLSREESDSFVDRIERHCDDFGYGLFAVELKQTSTFIGFVGLVNVPFETHFTPALEMGWRISADHWNKGFATEAARAILDYGQNLLKLKNIVSFTVPHNIPSRRVMEKIGLTHIPVGDFNHPKLELGHPLCRHVLYKLK